MFSIFSQLPGSWRNWLLLFSFLLLSNLLMAQGMQLWYSRPASVWNEALPLGNGRLAAMLFGGTSTEHVQLNEETVWSGEPGNNITPGAYESIQQIRQLVFAAKYKEAQELSNASFPRNAATGNNYGMQYQSVGDLFLRFSGHEQVSDYRRDLDIGKAIATVSYSSNGIKFKREVFASLTDGVIVMRLTADKPQSISLQIAATSGHTPHKIRTAGGQLIMTGTTSTVENKKGRVQFEMLVQPVLQGGKLLASDTALTVSGADALTLYISIGTNVKRYDDISGDAHRKANSYLQPLSNAKYDVLKAAIPILFSKQLLSNLH